MLPRFSDNIMQYLNLVNASWSYKHCRRTHCTWQMLLWIVVCVCVVCSFSFSCFRVKQQKKQLQRRAGLQMFVRCMLYALSPHIDPRKSSRYIPFFVLTCTHYHISVTKMVLVLAYYLFLSVFSASLLHELNFNLPLCLSSQLKLSSGTVLACWFFLQCSSFLSFISCWGNGGRRQRNAQSETLKWW